MRDECAGKTKQTLFVDQSHCKVCCYFVFFQDYGTFFIYEGEEKLSFCFFGQLSYQTFDIKQGSPMTEQKEITICTWSRASDDKLQSAVAPG